MSFIVDQYYTYHLQNGRYAPILLELSALEQQHSQKWIVSLYSKTILKTLIFELVFYIHSWPKNVLSIVFSHLYYLVHIVCIIIVLLCCYIIYVQHSTFLQESRPPYKFFAIVAKACEFFIWPQCHFSFVCFKTSLKNPWFLLLKLFTIFGNYFKILCTVGFSSKIWI